MKRHWMCNCCEEEFIANTNFFSGGGDIPYGNKLEYRGTPQGAEPQNICERCARDAVIWASKQGKSGQIDE